MVRLLLIVTVLALGCMSGVFSQSARPVISEVFDARMSFLVLYNNTEYRGEGIHNADQRKGLNLEIWHFYSQFHLEKYRLQRFDMGKQFDLQSDNRTCNETALSGAMPLQWDWVKSAVYAGNRTERQQVYDIWKFEVGFSALELSVNSRSPNIPVWLRRTSRNETDMSIYYESFSLQPNASYFNIPKECQGLNPVQVSNSTTSCRSRADMLTVAKAWVAAKVPYNQGATHTGYREDCSGYVSACWAEAKPGLVTSTFHTVGKFITKAELLPGDALLYAAEHIVLFEGWTDSGKTHYTAYEETKPGEGTVTRATPYPYWYSTSDFLPFRADSVC